MPDPLITIGDVTPDDQGADYIIYPDKEDVWTDYAIANYYEKDGHICMLPITSPDGFEGNAVAFGQTATKTLLWIADWTASRWNTPPEIPDPHLGDSNWVLLDDHWDLQILEFGPDGETPLYRLSGTYVYGHKKPDKFTWRDVNFGRPPWIEAVFKREVPDESLTPDLIDIEGGDVSNEVAGTVTGTYTRRPPSPGDPGTDVM